MARQNQANDAPVDAAFQLPCPLSSPSLVAPFSPASSVRRRSTRVAQRRGAAPAQIYHRRTCHPLFGCLDRSRDLPSAAHVEKDIDASSSPWAALTASAFDAKLANGELALCLVGMSNCGKSYWSHKLYDHLSFSVLSVDRHIEARLDSILKADGHVGIEGLAAWMGFPSDQRFAANQATYLEQEEAVTRRVFPPKGKNSVVDTTGSVVYLSRRTRNRLVQHYLVVHLEAEDEMLAAMTDNYFKTPKPVVWGDTYQPLPDESPKQALRRCYPNLLRQRRERYSHMAHVTVPASISLDRSLNIDGFLHQVRSRLQQ